VCGTSHNSGLLDFIPESLPEIYLSTPQAFSRDSVLSIKETIAFILMQNSGGISGGLRPHLTKTLIELEKDRTLNVSNLCRTRYKIRSSAFEMIFNYVVEFTFNEWDSPEFQFCGRNVFAVDGSKFTLESSEELKNKFDPSSMSTENGAHYFPQCMVTTFYDVYRKVSVYRTVQPYESDERVELLESFGNVPVGCIYLTDRGYPSFEVFHRIARESSHDIVSRMPRSCTFKAVEEFVNSSKTEDIVEIAPSQEFLRKFKKNFPEKEIPQPLAIRLIRYTPKTGGEEIILATTLLDSVRYPTNKIIDLYWDRWQIELFYRDEKCYIESGKFRCKKEEGVRQELFASVIMNVVTRYHLFKAKIESGEIERVTSEVTQIQDDAMKKVPKKKSAKGTPQYLSAVTTLASYLPRLVSLAKHEAELFFNRIIKIVCSIRYYYQSSRPSKPRVTKSAQSKWHKGVRGILKAPT